MVWTERRWVSGFRQNCPIPDTCVAGIGLFSLRLPVFGYEVGADILRDSCGAARIERQADVAQLVEQLIRNQ